MPMAMSGGAVCSALWRHLVTATRAHNHPHPRLCLTHMQRYATKKNPNTSETEKPPLNMDVCLGANYFKTGEDPIIRPESEYPDWLWGLLGEETPVEASKQDWRRIRKKEAHRRIAALKEKH